MPPVRTTPSAPKPLKTERTHEENQERAYIAASRRSDRSLEARVESARRASEIHKRRTGRSLRVTEQDVVNEEMYEEEDDDLPMQYRRLTAHLQTSNAEFDRRLAAYLTNHVAMRTALGQAVGQQTQGYANAAQFANQGPQQVAFAPQSPMGPPQNRSPTTFRQSPYPMPNRGIPSPSATSYAASGSYPSQMERAAAIQRRSSLPVPNVTTNPHGQIWNRRNKSIHNLKLDNLPSPQTHMPSPPKSEPSDSKTSTPASGQQQQGVQPSQMPTGFDMSFMNTAGLPFSTALPMESQQLLGGAFNVNDPMTAMLMGNTFDPTQSLNSFDAMKGSDNSMFGGINQTLAPGFLDTSCGNYGMDTDSAFLQSSPFQTSPGGFGLGIDPSYDAFKASGTGNGLGSGGATPNGEWHSFIDGNAWEELSSTQS